jgi:hypothetical protein
MTARAYTKPKSWSLKVAGYFHCCTITDSFIESLLVHEMMLCESHGASFLLAVWASVAAAARFTGSTSALRTSGKLLHTNFTVNKCCMPLEPEHLDDQMLSTIDIWTFRAAKPQSHADSALPNNTISSLITQVNFQQCNFFESVASHKE